jgi:hypothetical protein
MHVERSTWLNEFRRLSEERYDTLHAPGYDDYWGGHHLPNTRAVFHMTLPRKLGISALIIYTFVITILRAFRSPNDFAEAHWLLDYRFGLVKRGLIGEIVSLLMGFMSRPITERKIFILSGIAFLIYCIVITVLSIRIIQRSDWSAGAVAVSLVFLSSPFVVMSAHLFGYFDNIIIVIGIFSVVLLIKGKPWLGACLQILALLIHENSMLLVFPPFCLALFLMNTRNNKSGIHITSFLPLLIPIVAFIVLMVAHEMFLAEEFRQIVHEISVPFPFIQDDRSTYAPEWISKSFLDYCEIQIREFFKKLHQRPCTGLFAFCVSHLILYCESLPNPVFLCRIIHPAWRLFCTSDDAPGGLGHLQDLDLHDFLCFLRVMDLF